MWIAVTSIAVVIALCAFIVVAIYLGTVAAIVIVATTCTVMVLGLIGLLLGIGAVIVESIQRRREIQHG